MRLSKASILAQALLLAAVAAQSLDASSLVNEITTTAAAAATTTAASPSPAETTQSPVTTSAAPSTTSTTSEAAPTTTSTQSTSSSTTTSVAEVPSTTNTPAPSTTADTAETSARSTTSQPSDETTTSVTPSVSSTIVIKTITAQITEDGTTKPTVMLSTSTSAVTSYPSLNGDKGSSNSGLSSSDKKIIIGVVVGVGGAILLGVLGVVFWRIQKKRSDAFNDEDDDLMGGTAVGSGPREKAPGPTQSGTPFKNTLDQYHNPGPVNAASNF